MLLLPLDKKVWEVTVSQNELYRIQQNFRIGNIQRKQQRVNLRIVYDSQPFETTVSLKPTLEDVYLYYFNEEPNDYVHT